MLSTHFKRAPSIRPQLNIGSIWDLPNGRYYIGQNGESILNGGLSFYTGVGGKGNTFKSTVMHDQLLTAMDRYASAQANVFDTEMSLTNERMYQLAARKDNIGGVDLEAEGRMLITDNTVMMGDEWFEAVKSYAAERQGKDQIKTYQRTTPFIDRQSGKLFQSLSPLICEVDSLSMMVTSALQGILDKAEIGNSGTNTAALRDAAVKTQMLNQLPTLTAKYNVFMMHSAHVGKQHQLDPYAPPARQLNTLKGQNAFKNVPEKFTFLPNNLYYVHSVEILLNKGDKAPEFPKDRDDKMAGDNDLQQLIIQNLRAKSGPTGMPMPVIVSQSEGVQRSLTEFVQIRDFNRFGLGGNLQNYHLEIYPNVNLSRTTIRSKLNGDAKLRRAMEITWELAYMYYVGYRTEETLEPLAGEEETLDRDLAVTAKELYDGLIAKGYDWDQLLNTRGYWMYLEDEKEDTLPFLSTMDLLRMHAGLYQPKWATVNKGKPDSAPTDSDKKTK